MKDQEDFHGDIGLAPAETAKTLKNPKSLKTAGFMPEEDALLEEIISKINERFDGIFSEGDRVIVETLYNRAKENKKLNRQAQKMMRKFIQSRYSLRCLSRLHRIVI